MLATNPHRLALPPATWGAAHDLHDGVVHPQEALHHSVAHLALATHLETEHGRECGTRAVLIVGVHDHMVEPDDGLPLDPGRRRVTSSRSAEMVQPWSPGTSPETIRSTSARRQPCSELSSPMVCQGVSAPPACRATRRFTRSTAQPRPMFGRLPWLAFERRMRALRFLVFLDIEDEAIGGRDRRHRPPDQPLRQWPRPSLYGVPVALVVEQT